MTCPETLALIGDSAPPLPCTEDGAHTMHAHRRDGRRVAAWVGSFGPEHLCECTHPEPGPCLHCDGAIR